MIKYIFSCTFKEMLTSKHEVKRMKSLGIQSYSVVIWGNVLLFMET